ncbi:alkene reductase [Flammeovirga yaeyamensis]|uniref:Alkene reductase n=1 Tax=Flammeovirga yaeyamensis TaxID=367791 RepID=A0AAX1N7B2_9BACT|nr:alkene reductase [Flammeovirga yaeyamensis]MBB3697940.1 N-ethylmaleimide reductase [Flammeovirga yaeyamensis]NMF35705.1 alkene reductase [Flammeovirga yaeyamensis]QWG03342.1 alkene reductase [Flammeovirga yaeyamensis]
MKNSIYQKLFSDYSFNNNNLKNRMVLAPMTRSRANEDGVPTDMMSLYYQQRASAGLEITEATQISLQGQGYANTPGIYNQDQVNAWKKVTNSVHEKGGEIFVQLWHVGRVGSEKVNGLQPLAPSALKANKTSVYVFEGDNRDATFVDVDHPKEMSQDEIDATILDFRKAARNAIEAGFDGVEIHGANGYLIDQFLRSNANKRSDKYGGSKENRARFLLEVTQAVVNEIGADKVGVRLSPFIMFKDMDDPEILDTIMYAVPYLDRMGITYLHLCEADWDDAPQVSDQFRIDLRKEFHQTIIVTGNMTPEKAENLLEKDWIDLVGFGRKFISNPDYPQRVLHNAPLQEITDTHTLFGGRDERGYTDYPSLY